MYYSLTAEENPKLKDFFYYLEYRGVKLKDFMSLPFNKREETFLKWKWGGSVHSHNIECEITRRYLTKQMNSSDLKRLDEKERIKWESILKFETKCLEIKREIGLIQKISPEIKKVKDLTRSIERGWE